MVALFDCDILSTFAKINQITLLEKTFSKVNLYYSLSVYQEILKAQDLGFTFPGQIFRSKIKIIFPNQKESKMLRDFFVKERFLHLGELESMAIVKNRKGIFITNDKIALDFCLKHNIDVLDLKDCLKIAALKKIISKKEMEKVIKEIEIKDFTFIKNKKEILDVYWEWCLSNLCDFFCGIGTKVATKVLKDGDLVEVDADKGVVKILNKSLWK